MALIEGLKQQEWAEQKEVMTLPENGLRIIQIYPGINQNMMLKDFWEVE